MHQTKRKNALMVLAVTTFISLGAVAHELGRDATAAEEAIAYRDGIFHVMGWKMDIMNEMAKGNRSADSALFIQSARDIALLADWVIEGFIPDSSEDSLAKPDIWEDFDDFKQKNQDMQKAAMAIAESAEQDLKAAMGKMRDFSRTCNACHRSYKVRNR